MSFKIISWHRTGSSFTVNPPIDNTDLDVCYLVESLPWKEEMESLGWKLCEHKDKKAFDYAVDPGYLEYWAAYRLGPINAIITSNKELYLRQYAAMLLCKELNVKDKDQRVSLFRLIKNSGNACDYLGPVSKE